MKDDPPIAASRVLGQLISCRRYPAIGDSEDGDVGDRQRLSWPDEVGAEVFRQPRGGFAMTGDDHAVTSACKTWGQGARGAAAAHETEGEGRI